MDGVILSSIYTLGDAMSGNSPPKDDDKVEIVVSVSLRQRNENKVVGETSVEVDRETLGNSPVNVTMNLQGQRK